MLQLGRSVPDVVASTQNQSTLGRVAQMKTIRFCAVAVGVMLSTGFVTAATAATVSSEEQLLSAAKQGPYAKIGPLLGNLHEEYSRSSNKKEFKTSNPTLKVHGGRVGVDLYATDAVALRQALAS